MIQGTGIFSIIAALTIWAQPTSEITFPLLQKQFNSQADPVIKSRLALALGVMAQKLNHPDQAMDFLKTSLTLGTRLDDYARYHLGLLLVSKGQLDDAIKEFEQVSNRRPVSTLKTDADMELTKISFQRKEWLKAIAKLRRLERSQRGTEDYPTILSELVVAHYKSGQKSQACHNVLKLYTRYPMLTVERGWGNDLSKVKVDDEFFLCQVSRRDRERRIDRLVLLGEMKQAKDEVAAYMSELRKDDKAHIDEIAHIEWVNARIAWAEARLGDVVTSLLRIHDLKGKTYETQMMLAKTYAQMDEYKKAIMTYRQSTTLARSSRMANQALFQAAFLSYRNRDYDGASRSFEKILAKARGQIQWDSRWHLAWIRYLKGDYDGAIKNFNELLKSRYSASRLNRDKIYYWRAMAELRNNHPEAARLEFEFLAQQKYLGYYAGASMARLAKMPNGQKISLGRPLVPGKDHAIPEIKPEEGEERNPAGQDGSLETVESGENEDGGMRLDADTSVEAEVMEAFPKTVVKDPQLAKLFDRSKDLIELGFSDWARNELRNIERRTRNKGYLLNLMTEYNKVNDFHRSAYIADVIFGDQREKGGIDQETQLWMAAFPKAYPKATANWSKRFDVPPALLWSVMRGESSFRENVHSSAGAMGLMQLISPTARRLAKDLGYDDFSNRLLLNPEINIQFGARYLKRLMKTMDQQLPMVLGSYNAGPHRMKGWLIEFGNLDMDEFIEHVPYVETRNYIKKVLRNYMVYQLLYEKKNNPLQFLIQKPIYDKNAPKPNSESWDDLAQN